MSADAAQIHDEMTRTLPPPLPVVAKAAPTVGIAMIARNGGEIMGRAVGAFLDYVDGISIVLGGTSDDDTKEVAFSLVSQVSGNKSGLLPLLPSDALCIPITDYQGDLDAQGRILDFSAARNQAIQHLTTDWLIVIDCDDVWTGAENIRQVIEEAEAVGASQIMVAYGLPNSEMWQGRIFRRTSGQYVGPVHELWTFNKDEDHKLIKTDKLKLTQERPEGVKDGRLKQNIAISEAHLKEHPTDERALLHLVQDYGEIGDFEKSIEYGQVFLGAYPAKEKEANYYRFRVQFLVAMAQLQLGQFEDAMTSGIGALGSWSGGQGQAWAIVAEAAGQMAIKAGDPEGPLHRLTIMAADEALRFGIQPAPFPVAAMHVQSAPYHIKARAFFFSGFIQQAKAAAEIGLALAPDNEALRNLYNDDIMRVYHGHLSQRNGTLKQEN